MPTSLPDTPLHTAPYLDRYRQGQWRSRIFTDLILADAANLTQNPDRASGLALLDIGCGLGFDHDTSLQGELAAVSAQYIGIEPDPNIKLADFFTASHRCFFEDAPLAPASIDIAFACMVLEHLPTPQLFFDRLYDCLKPGGIFWGFTVDARHPFVAASQLSGKLGIKDFYLNLLHGEQGESRYENYATHYLSNTPDQAKSLARSFQSCSALNFESSTQLDYYFPAPLQWVGRSYCGLAMKMGWPGCILAIRLQK